MSEIKLFIMKNALFTILFEIASLFSFSQNYLTNAEIYDFDIGDEFHYHYTGREYKYIRKITGKTYSVATRTYNYHE